MVGTGETAAPVATINGAPLPMVTRVLAIVPAYNEAEGVGHVVRQLLAEGAEVLVVDDGSSDDTAALALAAGAAVIRLPTNLGIGGALQAGFRHAHAVGYPAAFQCDADGQHSTAFVGQLIKPLVEGRADLVIGSRFADGSDPYRVGRFRRVTMRILAVLISRISGVHLTDVSSGFRAFGPRALALFSVEYPHEYMESVEALVIAARAGLHIEEVSIVMHERGWGEASNRSFRAGVKTLRMVCSVVLLRLRPLGRPPWES